MHLNSIPDAIRADGRNYLCKSKVYAKAEIAPAITLMNPSLEEKRELDLKPGQMRDEEVHF
jgi:hypothetical protein